MKFPLGTILSENAKFEIRIIYYKKHPEYHSVLYQLVYCTYIVDANSFYIKLITMKNLG